MSELAVTEKDIRDSLRTRLSSAALASGARVFEELTLENGAARVDFAVVGERLHAFEIKSDLDNFSRLHNQIHAYNRVFDSITMVTTQLHLTAAIQILPSWWGVQCVRRTGGATLEVHEVRPAAVHDRQDARSLAMFLWREEALHALRNANRSAPTRANRWELAEAMASAFTLPRLREVVSQALLSRVPKTASDA